MSTLTLKDCAFTLQMGGVRPVHSLRDLANGLRECSTDCLYHHFCHPVLRRVQDDAEFHNDLSTWASRELRDRVLAEQLSMINPFAMEGLEHLRARALEIVERRIQESGPFPEGMPLQGFHFIRSVTVVFPTPVKLNASADFMRAVGEISDYSLYYHFIEARTANGNREDDFVSWFSSLEDTSPELVESIQDLDFYYMTLDEVRHRLLHLLGGR